MSLPVNRTTKLHNVGDSLVNFHILTGTGGLVDQIQNRWSGSQNALVPAAASGIAMGIGPSVFLAVTESGGIGNKAADIAAAVAARINAFTPDSMIITVGVNDASAGTAAGAFRTSYDSIISQALAFNPAMKIGGMSIFCFGELWQAGGDHWGPNAFDANIATLNAQISASCIAAGQTYIDVRTPAGLWESTNNGAAPGVAGGILTLETVGVHQNASGIVKIGNWVLPSIAVGP